MNASARRRPTKSRIAAAALLMCFACSTARADEVIVAVAANFAGPFAQLSERFSADTGHIVKASTGSTGKFYSQVRAGAPFEVLLAADDETPGKLVAEGLAVAGSQFTYAIGQLALWSAQAGRVDAQGTVLSTGRYARLAIANPKLAPYGRAAMEVLRSRGLEAAVAPKLVTGESIAQAFQFVASGNAELGFVALSQVVAPGQAVQGSYWRVPSSLHGEIRQDAVLLKPGERNPAALALLAYLKTGAARELMRAHGYSP